MGTGQFISLVVGVALVIAGAATVAWLVTLMVRGGGDRSLSAARRSGGCLLLPLAVAVILLGLWFAALASPGFGR